MKRTIIASAFLTFACFLVISLAGSSRAAAQTACCPLNGYVSGIPKACLPIAMKSSWEGLVTNHSLTQTGAFSQGYLALRECTTANPIQFDWVEIGGTQFILPSSGSVTIGTCTYNVTVNLDASGCVQVLIT